MSPAAAVAAAVVVGVARWWWPRAIERASATRYPVGADGIIPGAEPIAAGPADAASAVLILHGFGDTPESVAPLARALAARGHRVRAPLLAGHGRTLHAFAASGAEAWLASARDALDSIVATRPERLAIVGQSLGGALAALLANDAPLARRVVLLAPYLDAPPLVRWFARWAPLFGVLVPYLTTSDERSILDPEARARSLGFRATTPRLTRELVRLADRARAAFPAVRAPVRYLQSRQDNRIAPTVAERAAAARPGTELIWIEGSGHVLTADRKRDEVAALVAAWVEAS